MKCIVWLGLLSMLLFSGCATVDVSSDYNPETDFSRYHTYAWIKTKQNIRDNIRVNNDLFDTRIKKAVNHQLAQLGFIYDNDTPDFLVRYTMCIREETELRRDYYDHPFDIGWHYGYYDDYGFDISTRVYEKNYDKLTLVLEFIDTATDTLMWQGTAQDYFNFMTSPEHKDKQISNAVNAILAEFKHVRTPSSPSNQ